MKSCLMCKKEDAKTCSRCHMVSYCSKKCQKLDWKRHKIECNDSNKNREKDPNNENIKLKSETSHISNNDPLDSPPVDSESSACSFICTEIPGKGEGLIATRDIEYGELIINERPIMEMGQLPLQKEKDLKKLFKKLSTEDQDTIMGMYDAHTVNGDKKSLVGIVHTNSLARLV